MQLVTICSISIMCISGIFLIITLAYFLAHVTYLYGFENCRETIAVIKDLLMTMKFRMQIAFNRYWNITMILQPK